METDPEEYLSAEVKILRGIESELSRLADFTIGADTVRPWRTGERTIKEQINFIAQRMKSLEGINGAIQVGGSIALMLLILILWRVW